MNRDRKRKERRCMLYKLKHPQTHLFQSYSYVTKIFPSVCDYGRLRRSYTP